MKGHQRRAIGVPDFWKLASWDSMNSCWRDGKRQYDTRELALTAAVKPGRYRLSFIQDNMPRKDFEEFAR